jgi:tRNA (guanosine-2'-O-)-methyltransferase
MTFTPEEQIEVLREFMLPARKEGVEKVLSQRTQYLTIVLENIYHPQNASAVVRTCECFGIQDIHIIEEKKKYRPNADVVRGASKWLNIQQYHSTNECIKTLKDQGYKIAATTLEGEKIIPIEEVPLDSPLAICFGTEDMGLSDEIINMADFRIKIPMYGFTESFNISVAAAICLYSASTRLRNSQINSKEIGLKEDLKDKLRLDWHKKCVKNADKILIHRDK